MMILTPFLARLIKDESGAPAIEYALMAALVALAAAAGMTTLGNGISTFFGNIGNQLNGAVVPTITTGG